jgi:hypothetical protein
MSDLVTADGEIALDQFEAGTTLKFRPRIDDCYRLTMTSRKDVDAYARLSDAVAARGTFRLGPTVCNDHILLEDSCRFARAECPADTLYRLSLRGDGLAPCPTGEPIARLGVTAEQMRAATVRTKQEATARRDCAACEVGDLCPRCPLTGPISEQEYCQLQVARARTGWFDFKVLKTLAACVQSFNALVSEDPTGTVEFAARAATGVVPGPGLPGAIATHVKVPNNLVFEWFAIARRGPGHGWHLVTTDRAMPLADEIALGVGLILDGWDEAEVRRRVVLALPDADVDEVLDDSRVTLQSFVEA